MSQSRVFFIDSLLADACQRLQKECPEGCRLIESDLEWYAFPQVWPSSALGFGGVGGQTMTRAQTYVVWDRVLSGKACVYFGGGYAYMVHNPGTKFYEALRDHSMPAHGRHGRLEG